MEQEEAAIVSRQTKSCRREVAQLQLLSKVTNCFHCALLFADSCRVQHKIRSQLLTESWKKANYCLTSLLKWQCCPQDCETYSIKLNLLLPTMTTANQPGPKSSQLPTLTNNFLQYIQLLDETRLSNIQHTRNLNKTQSFRKWSVNHALSEKYGALFQWDQLLDVYIRITLKITNNSSAR